MERMFLGLASSAWIFVLLAVPVFADGTGHIFVNNKIDNTVTVIDGKIRSHKNNSYWRKPAG